MYKKYIKLLLILIGMIPHILLIKHLIDKELIKEQYLSLHKMNQNYIFLIKLDKFIKMRQMFRHKDI